MGNREELKRRSRASLKCNYWRAVAVCFIVVFFSTAFTTSTRFITRYNAEDKISNNIIEVMGVQSTAVSVTKLFRDIRAEDPHTISSIIDSDTIIQVADATFDPNSAFVNGVKITDHMITDGFSISVFFLIIGFILKIIYNIFFTGAIFVGERRFFLENASFSSTNIERVLFIFRFRHFVHPALVMLIRWIKVHLWALTIVGGFVKRYEYIMVPYIVAENPEITTKDAFALSKKMMMEKKWDVFILDISFIGWHILNIFTAGVLNVFFVNPYKLGTFAALYLDIRQECLESEPELKTLFTDINLSPKPKFVSENNNRYPYEEYIVKPIDFRPLNAERNYNVTSYIMLFFLVAVVGWCFEVGMHLVGDGVFVNRGTMHGPWLPIFGGGGLFVLACMRKMTKHPVFSFITIAGVCTLIEYIVSVLLEMWTGTRWWDYSEYAMNLQGRICLYGALLFGFGGCAILYYIGPRMDDLFMKMPKWLKYLICLILCVLFIADAIYSYNSPNVGAGITDYEIPK